MRFQTPIVLGTALVLGNLLAGCGAASMDGAKSEAPDAPNAAANYPASYPGVVASETSADAPRKEVEEDESVSAAPMAPQAYPQQQPLAQYSMPNAGVAASPPPPPPQAPMAVAPRAEGKVAASKASPLPAATATAVNPVTVAAPPPPTNIAVAPPEAPGSEDYKDYGVNPVTDPKVDRFSTFAIDVDTASYSIARRKLVEGSLPNFASVRAEEFLNSFDYGYDSPKTGAFAVYLAAAPSPFQKGHHLVRVGVQGKRISAAERKPVHLVYLVDTSGSMQSEDKIGLAKKSLRFLTASLRPGDTVALCTYAGSVREVLAPTGIENRDRILTAIDNLTASGSTAMSSGIDLAYNLAARTKVAGHVNRVIVLSDGDANVGPTSHEEILRTIREHKSQGITLSTVGFGMGNYKDTMMEQLADNGDGNYSYVDSEAESKKLFSDQVSGLLEVIARDVKIQVEFDPSVVQSYRLIGYENRDVADKDFRNDKVDAGEIGSGHDVTAVYDVVLTRTDASPVTVRVRHKAPLGSEVAAENTFKMSPEAIAPTFDAAPESLRFAAAVVGFAEVLRQSPYMREVPLSTIENLARQAANGSPERAEFVDLVHRARNLSGSEKLAVAK